MKKFVVVMVALVVAAAFATPAFAELKLDGYYRIQGKVSNFTGTTSGSAPAKDAPTASFIDNRLRMRLTNTLNDQVKIVYFGEVDTPWGDKGKAALYGDPANPSESGGGKAGADGVNVETKNVYLEVKFNDQATAKAGVVGIKDKFEGMLIFDDAAGAVVNLDMGAKIDLVASKFTEGQFNQSDDKDFYAVEVSGVGPLFAGAYYLHDNSIGTPIENVDSLSLGVGADVKLSDTLGLDGWVLYQDHSSDTKAKEGSAFAATARAKVKGIGNFRLLYFSEDDDANDNNRIYSPQGAFELISDGLMIFLTDIYVNSGQFGRYALNDAAYAGYGLLGLTYTNKFTIGEYYLRASAGYFQAMDDSRDNEAVASKQGDVLGFEADVQVGRKLADKVDVSIRGAYASLGDFYDAAPGLQDPDDLWKAVLMINVPY